MYLMDEQLWLEAIEAVSELISLSEQGGDEYFLNDARFRKAVCLKALGRHAEIPSQKRNIVPDTEVLIGDKFYTLEDLD